MPATILAVTAVSCSQPHPPNFTPIGAIGLFGSAHFARRRGAFLVPLAAMVFSDAIMAVAARIY